MKLTERIDDVEININEEEELESSLEFARLSNNKFVLCKQEPFGDRKLWRIMACKDFGNVKKGDLGGLVETEGNLSHLGNCWIGQGSVVCGDASVCGDAQVYGNVFVFGKVEIRGKAEVYGSCLIYDTEYWIRGMFKKNIIIRENARVHDTCCVAGKKIIIGENADICGGSLVHGTVTVEREVRDEIIIG